MRFVSILALSALAATTARAQEKPQAEVQSPQDAATLVRPPTPLAPTFDLGPIPLDLHGYATQGAVISDHNNYYVNKTNAGSLKLTEVALNLGATLNDRTRLVAQVATVINDRNDAPKLMLDFGFVDFRLCDALGFRVGRFRVLSSLYNESWDTDIARVPIFLPTSVYEPQGRQFFLTASGVQVYGAIRSDDAGSLEYSASFGTKTRFSYFFSDNYIDWEAAARVIYTTPFQGLRFGVGGSSAKGGATRTLDAIAQLGLIDAGLAPAGWSGQIDQRMPILLRGVAFAELSVGAWQLATEVAAMHLTLETQGGFDVIVPDLQYDPIGFYVMSSYRFADWFTAGGYASFHLEDKVGYDAPNMHSYDFAATLRFDVSPYLALKLEGHRILGSALLVPELNPTGPTADNGWLLAFRISAAF